MDVDEEEPFLDTVEGEISFFRSIMRTRPVGIHRHFHVLAMRNSIYRDTGRWVSANDIWEKLKKCYELDILESIEADGYDTPDHTESPPANGFIPSPQPEDNLFSHPYFRREFALPHDEDIEAMVATRRMRATASLPSSSPSPPPQQERPRQTKRTKQKASNLAGLVGGDSDSSALTQESGDESISPPPHSVATGTDGGTEYAEEEEGDVPLAQSCTSLYITLSPMLIAYCSQRYPEDL
ncbi:hypothetical protein K474DRAFT_1606845 [Panus rudis PR-1116 ss-1]|nr:hypothetical protein K474DRAFT_1606845 [Panus rudis PR-1116 ss-1]